MTYAAVNTWTIDTALDRLSNDSAIVIVHSTSVHRGEVRPSSRALRKSAAMSDSASRSISSLRTPHSAPTSPQGHAQASTYHSARLSDSPSGCFIRLLLLLALPRYQQQLLIVIIGRADYT
ncbi:hypothetical protein KCU88_g32, partial [Aureobasidium melanogenum]